jgi:hypothetical protein
MGFRNRTDHECMLKSRDLRDKLPALSFLVLGGIWHRLPLLSGLIVFTSSDDITAPPPARVLTFGFVTFIDLIRLGTLFNLLALKPRRTSPKCRVLPHSTAFSVVTMLSR